MGEIRGHGAAHQNYPKTGTDSKYLCYMFYTRLHTYFIHVPPLPDF